MDPSSIQAFKHLEFLKSQLEGFRISRAGHHDEFVDRQSSMGLERSLGELLSQANSTDAFVYTSGKQQKADYKISESELARRSSDLQNTVRTYASSLEKVNELEVPVFRHKVNKYKNTDEHPKTRMRVIWDDSAVSPLKLDIYRTR